jgi:hypothetical protein
MIWYRPAALPDDDRLDDALLGDRRHQLFDVAQHLARLLGFGSISSISSHSCSTPSRRSSPART